MTENSGGYVLPFALDPEQTRKQFSHVAKMVKRTAAANDAAGAHDAGALEAIEAYDQHIEYIAVAGACAALARERDRIEQDPEANKQRKRQVERLHNTFHKLFEVGGQPWPIQLSPGYWQEKQRALTPVYPIKSECGVVPEKLMEYLWTIRQGIDVVELEDLGRFACTLADDQKHVERAPDRHHEVLAGKSLYKLLAKGVVRETLESRGLQVQRGLVYTRKRYGVEPTQTRVFRVIAAGQAIKRREKRDDTTFISWLKALPEHPSDN